MGPDEETVEEVLVRKRALRERMDLEIREARRAIENRYAEDFKEIEKDLDKAVLTHALNMALSALTPEQQKEVLGN